jgi:hypothetical protein
LKCKILVNADRWADAVPSQLQVALGKARAQSLAQLGIEMARKEEPTKLWKRCQHLPATIHHAQAYASTHSTEIASL